MPQGADLQPLIFRILGVDLQLFLLVISRPPAELGGSVNASTQSYLAED